MMLHKDYNRKCSVEEKILAVDLNGLGAKTNWLAANRQSYSDSDSDSDSESSIDSWMSACEEII
jgi:hypothetical protein